MDEPEVRELLSLQQRTLWFESMIEALYRARLRPGDVAVDGGAHLGLHTYPMAECVGASGRVHAFELVPPLVAEMRRRIGRLPQVTLHPRALSDQEGQATFQWVSDAPGLSGLQPRDYEGREHQIEVMVVERLMLDNLPRGSLDGWRFMKLDLEGGEYRAIRGGVRRIAEQRPMIVFENGRAKSAQFYGYSMEDWFGLFEGLGYETFDIWGRPFTRASWSTPNFPYYFIGVARESDDAAFVREELPALLEREIAKAREKASAGTD